MDDLINNKTKKIPPFISLVILYHNFVNISTVSPVRICLQTRNARNASTKFRKTSESCRPSDSLFCGKATAVEKPHRGFSKSRLSSPSINMPKEKTPPGVVFSFVTCVRFRCTLILQRVHEPLGDDGS